MLYLKQSTATQAVLIGPFIDDTDGKTAETGLTIANTDIRLSANGGNMFSKTSGGGTHDEAGWYTITLDATDTATVGRLQISTDVSGALPTWAEFQIVEEDAYEWLLASGAAPDTQVAAIKAETALIVEDTGTTLDGRIPAALISGRMNSDVEAIADVTSSAIRLGALFVTGQHGTAAGGAAGSITLNGSADANDDFYTGSIVVLSDGPGKKQYRLITAYNGTSKVATITPNWVVNPNSSTSYAIISMGSVNIEAVSNAAQTAGDLAALIVTADAAIDVAVADLANGTDGLGAIKAETAAIVADTGTDGVVLAANAITEAKIADNAFAVEHFAAAALTAAKFGADFITAAKIAPGAIAKGDQLTGLNDLSAAQVNTEADNAIETYKLDHLVAAADGDDPVDNSIIAKMVSKAATANWSDFVNTTDSLQAVRDHATTIKTETALIVADTNETQGKLPTNKFMGSSDGADDDGTLTDILTDTAQIGAAGAGLTGLGGMSATMKGQVNTEVLDVMNTDTITLPGQGAPPLAPTHRQAIGWLYKAFRNRKKQDATSWLLYADNQTTVDAKATISDDATDAIKQEIVSGP